MAEDKEVPYVVVEKRGSGLGSFLLGAVLGAAAGLLFAPKSGEETQRELREGALKLGVDAENKLHELREELADVYERARDDVTERVDRARSEVRERKRQAQEAVRAGTRAARDARTDLEERVEESKRAYKEAVAEADEPVGAEGETADEETEAAETEA